MKVHVLAFARVRELLGAGELSLEFPDGATIADVRERLGGEAPRLGELGPSLRFARNQALAVDDETLCEGDEIALLPPVSGG